MRFCIVGAGAIGGFVGAKLAIGGEDVVFIARGKNLEAINASGMKVFYRDGREEVARVSATDDYATAGKFDYGGGHMEKHASLMGLGAMTKAALATAIREQIGTDIPVSYSQPQLAGGIYTSADVYARFLRKILAGNLRIGSMLGSHAVCTNRLTCGSSRAVFAPLPPDESWHYSVGHWVEDDPVVGDGAFSSPGALGFYPWIDATRTNYGVLARSVPGGAFDSVQCGRLIRKAWASATAL